MAPRRPPPEECIEIYTEFLSKLEAFPEDTIENMKINQFVWKTLKTCTKLPDALLWSQSKTVVHFHVSTLIAKEEKKLKNAQKKMEQETEQRQSDEGGDDVEIRGDEHEAPADVDAAEPEKQNDKSKRSPKYRKPVQTKNQKVKPSKAPGRTTRNTRKRQKSLTSVLSDLPRGILSGNGYDLTDSDNEINEDNPDSGQINKTPSPQTPKRLRTDAPTEDCLMDCELVGEDAEESGGAAVRDYVLKLLEKTQYSSEAVLELQVFLDALNGKGNKTAMEVVKDSNQNQPSGSGLPPNRMNRDAVREHQRDLEMAAREKKQRLLFRFDPGDEEYDYELLAGTQTTYPPTGTLKLPKDHSPDPTSTGAPPNSPQQLQIERMLEDNAVDQPMDNDVSHDEDVWNGQRLSIHDSDDSDGDLDDMNNLDTLNIINAHQKGPGKNALGQDPSTVEAFEPSGTSEVTFDLKGRQTMGVSSAEVFGDYDHTSKLNILHAHQKGPAKNASGQDPSTFEALESSGTSKVSEMTSGVKERQTMGMAAVDPKVKAGGIKDQSLENVHQVITLKSDENTDKEIMVICEKPAPTTLPGQKFTSVSTSHSTTLPTLPPSFFFPRNSFKKSSVGQLDVPGQKTLPGSTTYQILNTSVSMNQPNVSAQYLIKLLITLGVVFVTECDVKVMKPTKTFLAGMYMKGVIAFCFTNTSAEDAFRKYISSSEYCLKAHEQNQKEFGPDKQKWLFVMPFIDTMQACISRFMLNIFISHDDSTGPWHFHCGQIIASGVNHTFKSIMKLSDWKLSIVESYHLMCGGGKSIVRKEGFQMGLGPGFWKNHVFIVPSTCSFSTTSIMSMHKLTNDTHKPVAYQIVQPMNTGYSVNVTHGIINSGASSQLIIEKSRGDLGDETLIVRFQSVEESGCLSDEITGELTMALKPHN